ncbi:hypothetical protein ACJMK2_034373 [Sinanodonta woodiana]|uniref:STAS domain-containing protein n=1 Tax=Sinanodonta woodiana TaxID=1069815 RepID=A0ABD3WUV2_SINWO
MSEAWQDADSSITLDAVQISSDKPKELFLRRFMRTQNEIESHYQKSSPPQTRLKLRLKAYIACSRERAKQLVIHCLPILVVLRNYKVKEYLVRDILAGISVSFLHVSQGLAFGLLASLTPAHGLYTSFFPVLLYLIFGTSPHSSFGTNSIISLVTAELVESASHRRYSGGLATHDHNISAVFENVDDETLQAYKASVASGASLLSGIIMLTCGLLKLGVMTTYLSTAFTSGLSTAAAIHIIVSQIPKALGLQVSRAHGIGKIVITLINIFKSIAKSNVASIVTALICGIIVFVVKFYVNERFKEKLKLPVPIDLVIIVLATIISHFARFNKVFNIEIVKNIPLGFPKPELPDLSDFGLICEMSIKMSALIFLLSISLEKTLAIKHGYEIDDNQELVAFGLSNVVSSFFLCMPSSVNPPRSMLLSGMRACTTFSAFFTLAVMLLVLLVIGPLFASLPISVIASMVIVAVLWLLLPIFQLPSLWKFSKYDCITYIVTFLSGVLLDLTYGLICGIACSFYVVILQSQMARSYIVGKSVEEDIFMDSERYMRLNDHPNIKIYSLNYSLYYATSELFMKKLYKKISNPRRILSTASVSSLDMHGRISIGTLNSTNDLSVPIRGIDPSISVLRFPHILPNEVKVIIIDCHSVNFIDTKGLTIMKMIISEYDKVQIKVYLAGCSEYMLHILEHSDDFYKVSDKSNIFLDVFDAYEAARLRIKGDSDKKL